MSIPEPVVRRGKDPRLPAGPPFWPRVFSGRIFRMNAVEFMVSAARDFGDLVHYRAAGRDAYQFSHPELAQEMLVRDAPKHHRGIVMQRSRLVLGEGLLTSEEPLHMRQRRLAQPAFHRERVAAYGRVIGRFAEQTALCWKPGEPFDAHRDMLLLALKIVGKTLFDAEVDGDVEKIAAAVDAFMSFMPLVFLPFSNTLQKLPIPAMTRIRRSRAELDALIYGMIGERRRDRRDRGDLLSMLLAAEDEEGSGQMSDEQVRDECLTVMLAGHETTANALSFALWLLATRPEAQQRLADEAADVLGDAVAEAAHYSRLRYAYKVFAEAMRLYPPVWVTARTAAENYEYRGFRIRAGSILLAPQCVMHRDPRFWDEPDAFRPERFHDEAKSARPRMSYFPFGAGNRQCIGEGLAWMEGVLTLASILRRWRLRSAGPEQIAVSAKVSLRPRGPVMLVAERR